MATGFDLVGESHADEQIQPRGEDGRSEDSPVLLDLREEAEGTLVRTRTPQVRPVVSAKGWGPVA
jgi:hypothetical protein